MDTNTCTLLELLQVITIWLQLGVVSESKWHHEHMNH